MLTILLRFYIFYCCSFFFSHFGLCSKTKFRLRESNNKFFLVHITRNKAYEAQVGFTDVSRFYVLLKHNNDVAAKYGVPKNTLSTWVKNKHKLITSLEKKGMSSSRKSTRCGSYDQIDKAVFHWFVGKRSQKVPIDGIILKEKALEFAKTLGIKEFKASDCWLNKWKKR